MNRYQVIFFACILISLQLFAQSWQSSLLYRNNDGVLLYKKDSLHNKIPNFSFAGYKKSESAIPSVPTVLTISPISGDNTALIQSAINTVGAMTPNGSGIRGAVLLEAGMYRIYGTLKLNFSGVVLRGVGNGADSNNSTILYGVGNSPAQRTILVAGGGSNTKWREQVSSTKTNITNDTVYFGDTVVTVASASNLSVGDNIVIYHPSTTNWLAAIDYGGTHSTDPEAEPGIDIPWEPGDVDIIYNRYIKAKSGNTLTLDIPVYHHLIKSLSQAYLYKYARTGILTNIGIENLRIDNDYASEFDEDHVWQSIDMFQLEDSWVTGCTMRHFGQSGIRTSTATRITIKDCNAIDPVSIITGERRYNFQFYHASQMILIQDCFASNGRHHYMSNGISSTSGNVFHNCTSTGAYASSEGHRLWTQACLYDNHVELDGPRVGYTDLLLALYCRGHYGTSHGWSIVNSVAWNCDVANGSLILQKPPLSQNYAIGCKGANITGHPPVAPFDEPEGFIEGSNTIGLEPQSLFTAQLQQRIGGYSEPTIQASNSSYILMDSTSVKLRWTNGNGQARLVIGRKSTTANTSPVDNTYYTADSSFGIGSVINTDSYVLFKGLADSVTIGNLESGSTYTFTIFEWNGSPGYENYLVNSIDTLTFKLPALASYSNGTGGGNWESASSWVGGRIPDSSSLVIIKSGDIVTVTVSGSKVGNIQIASGGKLTANGSNIGSTNTKFLIVYGTDIVADGILGTGSDGLAIKVYDSLLITGTATYKLTKLVPGSLQSKIICDANVVLNYRATSTSSGGALLLIDGGTAPNPTAKFSRIDLLSGKSMTFPNYSKLQQSSSQDQDWNFSTTFNIYGTLIMGDSVTAFSLRPATGNDVQLNIYGSVICRQLNLSAMSGGNAARVFVGANGILKVGQGISGSMDCTNPNILIEGEGTFQTGSGTLITVGHAYGLDPVNGFLKVTNRQWNSNTNFVFNGTALQDIGSIPDTVGYVTINNAQGTRLAKYLYLAGSLTLTSSKLYLTNTARLRLGTASSFGGTFSATNMIVPDTGAVIAKRITATGSITFPLGDTANTAAYLPVITNIAQGTLSNAMVSIQMRRGKHADNISPNNYLKRNWSFSTSGVTNLAATLTLKYADTDINGTESSLSVWNCDGSRWRQLGSMTTSSNQISVTGLSYHTSITAGEQNTLVNNAIVKLKAVLQGLYRPVSGNMVLADTLQLLLASSVSPYPFMDSCLSIVDSNSFLAVGKFANAVNGQYYLVVKHRNSIETWSANPLTVSKTYIISRDFSSSPDSVFGANLLAVEGVYVVFTADVNQDGFVDFSDLTMIDNDSYNFSTGYVAADLNGDAFVDFSDLTIADNNAYNFVGSVTPIANKGKPVIRIPKRSYR